MCEEASKKVVSCGLVLLEFAKCNHELLLQILFVVKEEVGEELQFS